jgi:hypothetical protein
MKRHSPNYFLQNTFQLHSITKMINQTRFQMTVKQKYHSFNYLMLYTSFKFLNGNFFFKSASAQQLNESRAAEWQSWLMCPSFIQELRIQKKFLFCLCHIWIQIYKVLTLEHYLLIYINEYYPIMLDPTRYVAKTPLPKQVCGEGPSQNVYLNCIDSTHRV